MTLLLSDIAQESSTTVGTGTYTLNGAATGFVPFSQLGDGSTTYYVASAALEWEIGIGTIRVGAIHKLERTQIVASSNANAAVDWPSGTKTIYSTAQPTALTTLLPAINIDSDLTAIGSLATTGLIARTGAGTAATRTLTAPAAGITVSNGNGVAGNPTLALANDLAAVEGLATTGLAERTGDGTWTTNTVTAFAKTLLDDTDAATAQSTLGGTTAGKALFTAATALAQSDILIVSRDWRGRNSIINGSFNIWQRGTSLGAATGQRYLADRWNTASVGTTIAPSRQEFTIGQTDVPGEPAYFHRSVVASVAGAGNYAILRQPMESVRTFAGKTITVSFYAKADASKSIAVELIQVFGTGGSASVFTFVGKPALTTSWQKFTYTISVPSITGNTIAGANDNLYFSIFFDAGSDFDSRTGSLGQQSGTFDIAQVQIEPGNVDTPFYTQDIAVDFGMCQRYYQTGYLSYYSPATIGLTHRAAMFLPVHMRGTPTLVITDSGSPVSFPATPGGNVVSLGGGHTIVDDRVATATGVGFFQSTFTVDAEL